MTYVAEALGYCNYYNWKEAANANEGNERTKVIEACHCKCARIGACFGAVVVGGIAAAVVLTGGVALLALPIIVKVGIILNFVALGGFTGGLIGAFYPPPELVKEEFWEPSCESRHSRRGSESNT